MRAITLTLHPAIDRVQKVTALKPGTTFDSALLLNVPAGKGVNTARGLSNIWPQRSKILSAAWLGAAETEWFQRRLFEISGIRSAICSRPVPTRFAHTIFEDNGRETHIKEGMRPVSPAEEREFLSFWRRLVRAGDLIALCGSAPAQTSRATLQKIFDSAHAKKTRAFIADTNGPALEVAGAAGLDGLKGNAAEIGAWLKLRAPLNLDDVAHRKELLRSFDKPGAPRMVLITLGAAGAALATDKQIYTARPPKIRRRESDALMSATGCGDAATAGWLWAILEKRPPVEMLACAVACGTAKLHSMDPGLLQAPLVATLLKQTKVERLSP